MLVNPLKKTHLLLLWCQPSWNPKSLIFSYFDANHHEIQKVSSSLTSMSTIMKSKKSHLLMSPVMKFHNVSSSLTSMSTIMKSKKSHLLSFWCHPSWSSTKYHLLSLRCQPSWNPKSLIFWCQPSWNTTKNNLLSLWCQPSWNLNKYHLLSLRYHP